MAPRPPSAPTSRMPAAGTGIGATSTNLNCVARREPRFAFGPPTMALAKFAVPVIWNVDWKSRSVESGVVRARGGDVAGGHAVQHEVRQGERAVGVAGAQVERVHGGEVDRLRLRGVAVDGEGQEAHPVVVDQEVEGAARHDGELPGRAGEAVEALADRVLEIAVGGAVAAPDLGDAALAGGDVAGRPAQGVEAGVVEPGDGGEGACEGRKGGAGEQDGGEGVTHGDNYPSSESCLEVIAIVWASRR